MMKPIAQGPHDTGLLEYLEDIIGTDKYKPQLEETSKRCIAGPHRQRCVTSHSWTGLGFQLCS